MRAPPSLDGLGSTQRALVLRAPPSLDLIEPQNPLYASPSLETPASQAPVRSASLSLDLFESQNPLYATPSLD